MKSVWKCMKNVCILFYGQEFKWNQEICGDNLEFDQDGKTVRKNGMTTYGYYSCVFGEEINSKICNKYSITFKMNKFSGNVKYPRFFVGLQFGEE